MAESRYHTALRPERVHIYVDVDALAVDMCRRSRGEADRQRFPRPCLLNADIAEARSPEEASAGFSAE